MYHQRFKTIEQRFAEKYEVAENGCWVWRGKDSDYPKFWTGSGYIRSSRFALQRKLGRDLHPGEEACHSCDNTRCVNPGHLFAGDHAANMRDRESKGRGSHRLGAANNKTRLTAEQVLQIRAEYATGVSQDALAAKFGIGQQTVSHITRRKTWKWLDGTVQTQSNLAAAGG